jgi:5-formyltetrahydrofolate cyclo-ligase
LRQLAKTPTKTLGVQNLTRSEIRQQIRERRKNLTTNQQSNAAAALLQRFSNDSKLKQAQHIALYLSNDGELNTQPLVSWCWQQGKNVYLPVIHPFTSGHLLFLNYTADTLLIKNHYGIPEPKLNVNNVILPQELDIICTPLVAFDHNGGRLGMGGGFYDRTLSSWYQRFQTNKNAKPYPIGLAHSCQQVDALPNEVWDIPLPEVITPDTHHKFCK